MKKADRANWTIEHEIILPPDQAVAARKRLRVLRAIRDRLGELVYDAIETAVADEHAEWDRLAVLLGYAGMDALNLADRTMEIDWYTGRLTLYRRSDEAGPRIGKEAEHEDASQT